MIFVTVGTHEQQFDRLILAIDNLANTENKVFHEIIVQIGYSNIEPEHCKWSRFVSSARMEELMSSADVIVTHGGPSSFIEAIAHGKTPVVVPRRSEFGEHVNNHQVEFVCTIAKRKGGILPCIDIEDLPACIEEAYRIGGSSYKSHNQEFCNAFEQIIERL